MQRFEKTVPAVIEGCHLLIADPGTEPVARLLGVVYISWSVPAGIIVARPGTGDCGGRLKDEHVEMCCISCIYLPSGGQSHIPMYL